MEPAPPRIYPRHCDFCRARYGCVCEIKEKLGFCWTCDVYGCECVKETPYVLSCVVSERTICSICESPYDCVCQLLIECGNCPTCIHLKEKCICDKPVIQEKEVVILEYEEVEFPCGCIDVCDCEED